MKKKDYMVRIKDSQISWTNKGTYKNLQKTINDLLSNEELIQIENSISHLHLIIKEYNHKVPQYSYFVYEEPIFFSLKGTYKNLLKVVNNIPEGEEFFQITTTPTHLHLITRKPKGKTKL
ncbi:hypothetical protein JXB41_08310 [Candidatus Woesearchaeota archaeon]|nr:hypothetical protein [Candidatus Woesearchaeota archaeon]